MKYKITDAAVKRLFDLFGDDIDRFTDPLPRSATI
jgi:hypothetical protein